MCGLRKNRSFGDMDRLQTPGDTTWFEKDRFGMFIHWGLYSLAVYHEWVMMARTMANAEKKSPYVHVLEWPYKHLHLDGKAYVDRVEYAQMLHGVSEVPNQGLEAWQAHAALSAGFDTKEAVTLQLPQVMPSAEIPVIELFVK